MHMLRSDNEFITEFTSSLIAGHTEIDDSNEYDYDPSGDTLNFIADYTQEQVVRTGPYLHVVPPHPPSICKWCKPRDVIDVIN